MFDDDDEPKEIPFGKIMDKIKKVSPVRFNPGKINNGFMEVTAGRYLETIVKKVKQLRKIVSKYDIRVFVSLKYDEFENKYVSYLNFEHDDMEDRFGGAGFFELVNEEDFAKNFFNIDFDFLASCIVFLDTPTNKDYFEKLEDIIYIEE